jgi:hypothetical protein
LAPDTIGRFRAVKRTAALVFACTVGASAPVLASDRGSLDDQMACTPDVYRLCAGEIPDEDAITVCLRQHKPQLSAGCRAVFSRPDTAKSGG